MSLQNQQPAFKIGNMINYFFNFSFFLKQNNCLQISYKNTFFLKLRFYLEFFGKHHSKSRSWRRSSHLGKGRAGPGVPFRKVDHKNYIERGAIAAWFGGFRNCYFGQHRRRSVLKKKVERLWGGGGTAKSLWRDEPITEGNVRILLFTVMLNNPYGTDGFREIRVRLLWKLEQGYKAGLWELGLQLGLRPGKFMSVLRAFIIPSSGGSHLFFRSDIYRFR